MHLIGFARLRGVDLQAFAKVATSETGMVSFGHFAAAFGVLLEATGDQRLGWHLGGQYNPVALGIVGQIIQASATVGEGLQKCFQELLCQERPLEVAVSDPGADLDLLKTNFGCPVISTPGDNYLRFDRALLSMPVMYADYQLLLSLEQVACRRIQLLRTGRQNFANTIREVVWRMLNPSFPSVRQLAEHLNISERQLQRQLRHEGTSYTDAGYEC